MEFRRYTLSGGLTEEDLDNILSICRKKGSMLSPRFVVKRTLPSNSTHPGQKSDHELAVWTAHGIMSLVRG